MVTQAAVYSSANEQPVYVNPNEAIVPTAVVQRDPNVVTQTVYGFLDFTTTIGNTVMVFSPQSAAVVTGKRDFCLPRAHLKIFNPFPILEPPTEPPTTTTTTTTEAPVIETRPITPNVIEIKPSKPTITEPIQSIVQVIAESDEDEEEDEEPQHHYVTPKPNPLKVPKTSPGKSKQKADAEQKVIVISSHVEVVEATPSPAKVVVHAEPSDEENSEAVEDEEDETDEQEDEEHETDEDENISVSEASAEKPVLYSSIVEVLSSDDDLEPVLQISNNIGEPEYDFLSRQPTEFVEETYKITNLKSTSPRPKPKKSSQPKNADTHPTGLVTKLGGTVVKDGVTTVHETSVIGTYISGKYAQVLQSTSHIFQQPTKPKIQPSSTLRILKTAAPSLPKSSPKHSVSQEDVVLPVESLFGNSPNPLVRSSRKPANPTSSFKNRFKSRPTTKDDDHEFEQEIVTPSQVTPPSFGSGKKGLASRNRPLAKAKSTRLRHSSSTEYAPVIAETVQPSYSSRRNKNTRFKPLATSSSTAEHKYHQSSSTVRALKPKIQPSIIVEPESQQSTSLYKFKLNRTPGRWQYKTTPKPRVTIRKNANNEITKEADLPVVTPSTDVNGNDIANSHSRVDTDVDLDGSGSVNGDVLDHEDTRNNVIERKLPVETIKVEISTPADFSDTYYEIATIKSPYTFQVGANKNTRYITVTSTFEKTLEPEPTSTSILTEPLTENILATTSHIDKEHNLLDSSIATLPPIGLADDQATPPLETLTETFSTTQVMLKTHILPVVRGGTNTTSYTLIQTYHVTRLVTATKTLPPMEVYQFVPSKTLNEFNTKLDEAGSELHLELEFGDENDHDEEDQPRRELPPDLDLSNIGLDFDISEVDKRTQVTAEPPTKARPKQQKNKHKSQQQQREDEKSALPNLTPEQLQQLALLRLLNPAAQIPSVITTSKPVLKIETVWESHVLPIINGGSTFFSTISRPIATVSKTEYEIGTSTLPALPIPPQPLNPFAQQQQQFQLHSTPVVEQTIVTQTDSKVLKLTFGAKTAYTTLYSTRVVPTMVTSYVTQSIPYQQTANAFPGYFPAPYAPFPYVG